MAVEKLVASKFAKIGSRQDALQTTFSVFVDIFYPLNSAVLDEKGVFQQPRDFSPTTFVSRFPAFQIIRNGFWTLRSCHPSCTIKLLVCAMRSNGLLTVNRGKLEWRRFGGAIPCHCIITSTWITPLSPLSDSRALPTMAPNIRFRSVPRIACPGVEEATSKSPA